MVVVIVGVVLLNSTIRRRWLPVGTRRVVVRCRHGHVFTTTWTLRTTPPEVPPVQLCPVCHHYSQVTLVDESTLTDAERDLARRHAA